MLREYIEGKQEIDWNDWREKLELHRSDLDRQLRSNLPTSNRIQPQQLDKLIDMGWNDLIHLMNTQSPRGTENTDRLEAMLKRMIRQFAESGKAVPSVMAKSVHRSVLDSTSALDKAVELDGTGVPDELVEELDELEEAAESTEPSESWSAEGMPTADKSSEGDIVVTGASSMAVASAGESETATSESFEELDELEEVAESAEPSENWAAREASTDSDVPENEPLTVKAPDVSDDAIVTSQFDSMTAVTPTTNISLGEIPEQLLELETIEDPTKLAIFQLPSLPDLGSVEKTWGEINGLTNAEAASIIDAAGMSKLTTTVAGNMIDQDSDRRDVQNRFPYALQAESAPVQYWNIDISDISELGPEEQISPDQNQESPYISLYVRAEHDLSSDSEEEDSIEMVAGVARIVEDAYHVEQQDERNEFSQLASAVLRE